MICKTCNTDKPSNGFYTSNKSRCKDCVKSSVLRYRAEHLERARAYDKMRASMPHRVAARKEYQATTAFAESHKAAAGRWSAKHPNRRKANYLLGNAIRDGKLKKDPCHVCGNTKAQAHHPDYDRPLDVVWLCDAHHKEAHAIAKEY